MESPVALDPSDEAPTPSHQPQGDNTGDTREDVSHGVVGQLPGSDGKTRPRRPRGRHAKDPLAKSIAIKCQRLEDFEAQLKEHLADSILDREHTTLEFAFPVSAAFMVAVREPTNGGDLTDRKTPYTYSPFNKTAITVVDALHNIQDPVERAIMLKGISKTLVEACQEVDGYRYSFHNHWISREAQASRFSYYCNDSVLNKGRAANEGASKIKAGTKVRKPVYDCHGLISVKFSVTKNNLELHYKHIPLHKTFEERAPPPRNGSRRKRLLEIFHPEKLVKPKRRKSSVPKPPKPKKSATEPPRPVESVSTTPARENSLAPLFDFLGRVEPDKDSPDTSEPPTVDVNVDTVKDAWGDGKINRKKIYPGMSIWNLRDPQIQKAHRKAKKTSPTHSVPGALPPPATTPAPAVVMPPSSSQTVTPITLTESELRARLQQAEQKIRDLEAEKQRRARGLTEPARPTTLQFQAPPLPLPPNPATPYPPPPPPPPAYFPPPQFQFAPAPHPIQWNYSPHTYPPYPYTSPGPPSLPYPHSASGSAPAATHPYAYSNPGPPSLPYPNPALGSAPHPHAYHYPPQPLPPLSQQRPPSNAPPAYGFVPNPLDPLDRITTRGVRSHLGPPQPPATPDSSSGSRVEPPRVEMQPTAQTPLSSTEPPAGPSPRGPSATAPEPSDETTSVTASAGPAQPASSREITQASTSTSTTTAVPSAPDPDPDPDPNQIDGRDGK
ncbi:uncharacterized protein Z520_09859 [Fonsecaea multimorphosa CBS 102226]|uniref:Uncharacterized protein n=1 Tax=Fonsecaea multimorphosa CBS 102226 TaxID=1442371 RepID=A0A0D2KCP4_9EURO|nr:uncharacterized protein Z520_09859 [Fonsecaea multimorphosa CBS 102226]KIX94473.1 hypothetical protein Z520_09859 [Fonsecaea multimorphosa CBS 102226]